MASRKSLPLSLDDLIQSIVFLNAEASLKLFDHRKVDQGSLLRGRSHIYGKILIELLESIHRTNQQVFKREYSSKILAGCTWSDLQEGPL